MWQLSNRQWGDGRYRHRYQMLNGCMCVYVVLRCCWSRGAGLVAAAWTPPRVSVRAPLRGRLSPRGDCQGPWTARPSPPSTMSSSCWVTSLILTVSVLLRWLYVEGGKDYNDEFDDILSFDPVKEIWVTVGHMAQRRREHAVTTLSAEQTGDLLNFCY